MNLVIDESKYNLNNLFFYEPVKNTVMDQSNFIRIIYSDENIILNGLYIRIDNFIQKLNNIEKIELEILNKYNNLKTKSLKLKEYFEYLLKKSNSEKLVFNLKISGIWETENLIGLTFKFMYIE
tara:strand:- start:7272 stop:7643 length:372 start_codon:yes stop_codon:yes gene_type:complete